jgi:hypothetical protein
MNEKRTAAEEDFARMVELIRVLISARADYERTVLAALISGAS